MARSKVAKSVTSATAASVSVHDFITVQPVCGNLQYQQGQCGGEAAQRGRRNEWGRPTLHPAFELQLLPHDWQEGEPPARRRREEHLKHAEAHGQEDQHREVSLGFLRCSMLPSTNRWSPLLRAAARLARSP